MRRMKTAPTSSSSALTTSVKNSRSISSSSANESRSCFKCLKDCDPKAVVCRNCEHKFHHKCVPSLFIEQYESEFECSDCVEIGQAKASNLNKFGHEKLARKKLNEMLAGILQKVLDENLELNFGVIYKLVDSFVLIEEKAKTLKYEVSAEFIVDVKQLVYDGKNTSTRLVKLVKDAESEVDDLETCVFCYEAKIQRPFDWFAQPCERRHEVVWAKLVGYPHWPAKVISKTSDGSVHVIFFGDHTSASLKVDRYFEFNEIHPEMLNKLEAQLDGGISEAIEYINNLSEDFGSKEEPEEI